MDSHGTNDSNKHWLMNERWLVILTIYRYYLMAAVALSVFALAKFLVNSDDLPPRALIDGSVFFGTRLGLFAFALWHLIRVDEKGVDLLHLLINGLVVSVLLATGAYEFQMLVYLLGNNPLSLKATSIPSLVFAAYFFVRTGGMSWYFRSLKKYADFKGRARRTEYWVFASVQIIISCAFLIIFLGFVGGRDLFAVNSLSILYILYVLAVMVPGCAVAVRRLHDTGRTGWWLIWVGAFIFSYNLVVSPWFQKAYGFCWYNSPCGWYPSTVMTLAVLVGITQICFFAFTVLDSEPGENQYGPNPRAVAVRPEQKVQEQHSKRGICPECGVKYGLIDLMAQPTMCSKCWKKSKSDSIR